MRARVLDYRKRAWLDPEAVGELTACENEVLEVAASVPDPLTALVLLDVLSRPQPQPA